MYARVLEFDGAEPGRRDEAIERIRNEVIPRLEQVDGFAGYLGLIDLDNRKAKAIVLWETREAAEAAEQQLAERRKQMTESLGLTIAANELVEAPVVEIRSAVRT